MSFCEWPWAQDDSSNISNCFTWFLGREKTKDTVKNQLTQGHRMKTGKMYLLFHGDFKPGGFITSLCENSCSRVHKYITSNQYGNVTLKSSQPEAKNPVTVIWVYTELHFYFHQWYRNNSILEQDVELQTSTSTCLSPTLVMELTMLFLRTQDV